jgi:hypothetical protein
MVIELDVRLEGTSRPLADELENAAYTGILAVALSQIPAAGGLWPPGRLRPAV